MQEHPKSNLRRNLAVILVIVLLAAALLIISRLTMNRQPDLSSLDLATAQPASSSPPDTRTDAGSVQSFVLVSVAGRPHSIEPLDTDRDVEIKQAGGETNVIHITRNGFHMASSTCDNQLCIGQGEVTVDNYTRRILGPYVLCLPNQVELQLVVLNATTPPDAPDI